MSDRMQVRVTLLSTQGGVTDEHTYSGEWFRKEKSIFIRYEEGAEGAEEERIRNVVRYRPEELSVTRRGAVESEQLFVPSGERRVGQYRSRYTSFQMEIETTELKVLGVSVGADGQAAEPPFTIEWQYELFIHEQASGTFHMQLRIEPALAAT